MLTSQYFINTGVQCVYVSTLELMGELGIHHFIREWRLFIDSSKSSLKVVLVHNGNKKPSIPVAYSVSMKKLRICLLF